MITSILPQCFSSPSWHRSCFSLLFRDSFHLGLLLRHLLPRVEVSMQNFSLVSQSRYFQPGKQDKSSVSRLTKEKDDWVQPGLHFEMWSQSGTVHLTFLAFSCKWLAIVSSCTSCDWLLLISCLHCSSCSCCCSTRVFSSTFSCLNCDVREASLSNTSANLSQKK